MITPFVTFIQFTDEIGVDNSDKITLVTEGLAGEAKIEILKRDLVDLVELAQEGKRHRERH